MAGTLLIIGITLFLVGTLVLAHDVSGRGRSWAMVIIPLSSMTYVREHWVDVWFAVMLRVVGACLVFAGIGVFVAQNPSAMDGRAPSGPRVQTLSGSKINVAADSVAADAAMRVNIDDGGDSRLSGVIVGQPFTTSRAELIDGVLSIQHGSGFIPDIEVRILTEIAENEIAERKDIYVQVKDMRAPEVQLSIVEPGATLPETKIFTSGYNMELQLAPLAENQLKGYLQIVLPGAGAKGSYLVGEFVAYTNHLHYRRGSVDLRYDHIDTLRYLAKQYVKNQYPEAAVERVQLLNTTMQLGRQSGTSIARVYFLGGRLVEKRLQFERGDLGWSLRPGGVETAVLSEGGDGLGVNKPVPSDASAANVEPPLEIAFEELVNMAGQRVVITDQKGEKRVSKIIGMRRGMLQLESNVGNGMVQYTASREDIAKLRFESGREILLELVAPENAADSEKISEGSSSGSPEASPEASPETIDATQAPTAPVSNRTATAPSSASATQSVTPVLDSDDVATNPEPAPSATQELDAGLAKLVALVGKTVEISSTDGKVRKGTLLAANKKEVKLAVRLGSGTLEYFYAPADIQSVKEMPR